MPLFLTVAFLHPHFNYRSVYLHSTLDIINEEKVIWDLGAMCADKMLDKGKEVIESEIKTYLRDVVNNVTQRMY